MITMPAYPHIHRALDTLASETYLRRATVYAAKDSVVKATRQRRFDGCDRQETYLVTVGKPNYAERQFILKCLDAGEPFPVKKVQKKFWPQKKKR